MAQSLPLPLDILIVGCSIAGPTLASFLLLAPGPASQRPRITILERSSWGTLSRGQNIDIRDLGIDIVRKLGLEKIVRASGTNEAGVQWVDANDAIWVAIPAAPNGPTSDLEVMRGRLAEICYKRSRSIGEQVEQEGGKAIEYIFGDYLDTIEQDGNKVHVKFAKSGARRSFDLVVGADGLQSRTRNMVWGNSGGGEAERVKRLGMYGGFFSMPRERSDSQWRRWFHAPGRRGIMLRPCDDRNSDKSTAYMYVINEKDGRLADVAAKRGRDGQNVAVDVSAQKALLKEYFADAGWESERVIREMMATDDFYYDMVAQVKMDKWSRGRIVLLGDAAYCASPISGMGTTLAMVGAYHLAGALTQQHGNDLDTAFARYEERMRPIVDRAQKLIPGAPHIMSAETAWGVWFQNAFIAVFMRLKIMSLLFWLLKSSHGSKEQQPSPLEDYGFRKVADLDVEKNA